MKVIAIILILTTSSMALHTVDQGYSSHEDLTRSMNPKSKRHQIEIEQETGLDGKVRSIRLDRSENVPGIRVYGNPKNRIIDSRKIEVSDPDPIYGGDPRGGGVPDNLENKVKEGRIKRIRMTSTEKKPVKETKTVQKRSTSEVAKKSPELEDLEGAEAKVFRPLFVYRQQVNKRKASKQKKKGYPKKYNPRVYQKPKPVYPSRMNFY